MNRSALTLDAPFGFSLSSAAEFYAGFTPMGGAAAQENGRLELAFLLDRTFEPVSVSLTQRAAKLHLELEGTTDLVTLRAQLGRMLGLDADGHAWAALDERDPVLGAAKQHHPGFFTAGFPSPYEAGIGGVLSHRSSIAQAAAVRRRLAETHGTRCGALTIVPSPRQLLAVKSFPGIPAPKLATLQGLARAALDGFLDAERLRQLPVELALAQLEQLPGVGPWTAGHLLFRGCSLQDALPSTEPRVVRAFAVAYGRPENDFARAAEAWRPFRMWASIVLVRNLARLGQWSSGAARRGGALSVRSPRRTSAPRSR